MKKLVSVLVVVLLVVFALSLTKDFFIKTAVEKGTNVITGLKLKVSNFNVGIIRSLVNIRGLRLYNPAGFKDAVMLDMPVIYVDYDLVSVIKGIIHLEEMRIDMKEFTVVKNEKGELNLDSLKAIKTQREANKQPAKEGGKAPAIKIDNLQLKIGKVIYKDYSGGPSPSVKEFNININERYTNIDDPNALVSLIVVKALMNTTIASLTNFDLGGLKGTLSETLSSAQKVVGETAAKAQKAIADTTERTKAMAEEASRDAQNALKDTTDSLKKTTDDLKGMFKPPFGDKE
ncbi:MAG: hypothetical protein JW800_07115 [Candidatus Omnitrophica bacterium]|nr:hypothetical protein [Candidatus Omnitrophota bacterium]